MKALLGVNMAQCVVSMKFIANTFQKAPLEVRDSNVILSVSGYYNELSRYL